jgi:hypothetical protein
MARVADRLSPASREAVARILAAWLHEKQLDALLREVPAQRPPPEAVPLHELAGRGGQDHDDTATKGRKAS